MPWTTPAPARDVTWVDLLAHPDVVEASDLRSTVGVLAFHAGLEVGTLEIARAVAERTGASLYTLAQPEDLRWHVPSAAVDPGESPLLRAFTRHVEVAIAIHGYGSRPRPWDVLLGGSNRPLAARVAAEMDRHPPLVGVDRLDDIPARLRGLHPDNPVNLPAGGGVQVELPVRARFAASHPAVVTALVDAVAGWSADPG